MRDPTAGSGPTPDGMPEPGTPAVSLTPREREVLVLLCRGLSNKAIARELSISLGTVKVHLAKIFRALEVDNRLQAVLRATATGLCQGGGGNRQAGAPPERAPPG